jgi:hypothetical protein
MHGSAFGATLRAWQVECQCATRKEIQVVILVQRSRRPRRWAGVAFFAALVVAMWWTERHESVGQAWLAPDVSFMTPSSEWTSAVDITGLVAPHVFSATTLIAPPANVAAEPSLGEAQTEAAHLSIVDGTRP